MVERVGMVGPELGLSQLQRLLEQRQGQVQFTGVLVGARQVVHAVERVGVVGAELGLPELERLLEQRQGQVELAGGLVAQARLFML